MTTDRASLRRRFEIRFSRDAVLIIGELVAYGAHYFDEHHPKIGFEPVLPFGVPLACKIQERLPNAPKIARLIVDRKIDALVRRTRIDLRLTIEIAWTIRFETEIDVIEIGIDARMLDSKPICCKVTAFSRVQGNITSII